MDIDTTTHYTLDSIYSFPEDGIKREIIDGVLYVTPDARLRHQRVVGLLTRRIGAWVDQHGGEVFPGCNVDLAADTHVEPDVVFLTPEHAGKAHGLAVDFAPDLVIEVSSPSTWRYDLGVKREALERFGVPEYWYVDLPTDRILVHRLRGGAYGAPAVYGRGETFTSELLPGLTLNPDDLLGPPGE